MGYGQASPNELHKLFRDQVRDSFKNLGVDVTYIPYTATTTQTGALGGTQKTVVPAAPITVKGYFVLNPSENIRKQFGVQDGVEAVLFLEKDKFQYQIDAKDKFKVYAKDFIPRNVKDDALFHLDGVTIANVIIVSLVTK